MPLILASASPSRLALLTAAGIRPVVAPADVDEPALEAAAEDRSAAAIAQLLAVAKAEAVAPRFTAGLVLGCDSVFAFEGEVHGKPHTPQRAAERWRRMRGGEGVLVTGHCLIDAATGERRTQTVATRIVFADLTDEEVDWYAASGEPLEVAGAFKSEGLASAFIASFDGDPRNVAGLSVVAVRRMASELGVRWIDLVEG